MSAPTRLEIERFLHDGAVFVVPHGVLDLASYGELRDALLKSALELPRAVVVDLGWLLVPTDSTLAVFSSVWMQVADWPGVPIMLVAARELDRRRLRRSSITRFLPVHPSAEAAIATLGEPPRRRRTLLELPCDPVSVAAARQFVVQTCARWECVEVATDAVLIASELVENAVRHAGSEPRLRLEQSNGKLTVAVYDDDPTPARIVEPRTSSSGQLGLVLVDKLSVAWNCGPLLSGGKVVWAVLRLP